MLLALSMMLPLACKKKEHIQEDPSVWAIYRPGATDLPTPWGHGAEEVYNKQRIIDFFENEGIEILEVKWGTEMPFPHHTGPLAYVYCRIYENDLAVMQEYGFD